MIAFVHAYNKPITYLLAYFLRFALLKEMVVRQ